MTMDMGMLQSTSSSVEALGFNYLRYGLLVAVNNMWTLVALFTAAVSFWRFNLLPFIARRHSLLKSSSPSSSSSVFAYESRQQPPTISPPVVDSDQSSTSVTPLPMEEMSSDGVVKGNRVYSRFRFGDDDSDVIVHHREDDDAEEVVSIRRTIHDRDQTLRFDVMKRLRLSDLGFYDYQDMRVLDGNVVKLWDDTFRSVGRRCG